MARSRLLKPLKVPLKVLLRVQCFLKGGSGPKQHAHVEQSVAEQESTLSNPDNQGVALSGPSKRQHAAATLPSKISSEWKRTALMHMSPKVRVSLSRKCAGTKAVTRMAIQIFGTRATLRRTKTRQPNLPRLRAPTPLRTSSTILSTARLGAGHLKALCVPHRTNHHLSWVPLLHCRHTRRMWENDGLPELSVVLTQAVRRRIGGSLGVSMWLVNSPAACCALVCGRRCAFRVRSSWLYLALPHKHKQGSSRPLSL